MRHSLLSFLVLIFLLVSCTSAPESTSQSETNSVLPLTETVNSDTTEQSTSVEKKPIDTTTSTEQTEVIKEDNTQKIASPAPVTTNKSQYNFQREKGKCSGVLSNV